MVVNPSFNLTLERQLTAGKDRMWTEQKSMQIGRVKNPWQLCRFATKLPRVFILLSN